MPTTPGQLAHTLVDRHRRQQQAQRVRATALRQRVVEVAEDLKQRGVVERVWLIGSLAWGGFGAGSDVDLVVSGCLPQQWARLWRDLSIAFEADLDLLRLEDLPDDFALRIEDEGLELG